MKNKTIIILVFNIIICLLMLNMLSTEVALANYYGNWNLSDYTLIGNKIDSLEINLDINIDSSLEKPIYLGLTKGALNFDDDEYYKNTIDTTVSGNGFTTLDKTTGDALMNKIMNFQGSGLIDYLFLDLDTSDFNPVDTGMSGALNKTFTLTNLFNLNLDVTTIVDGDYTITVWAGDYSLDAVNYTDDEMYFRPDFEGIDLAQLLGNSSVSKDPVASPNASYENNVITLTSDMPSEQTCYYSVDNINFTEYVSPIMPSDIEYALKLYVKSINAVGDESEVKVYTALHLSCDEGGVFNNESTHEYYLFDVDQFNDITVSVDADTKYIFNGYFDASNNVNVSRNSTFIITKDLVINGMHIKASFTKDETPPTDPSITQNKEIITIGGSTDVNDFSYYYSTDNGDNWILYSQPFTPTDVENIQSIQIKAVDIVENESNIITYFKLNYDILTDKDITFDILYLREIPNELPNPTKENFVFTGWYYDIDLTEQVYNGTSINEDITIYAKFLKNIKISFEDNEYNGAKLDDLYGVKVPYNLPYLEQDGYRFEWWYLDPEFTTIVDSNMFLYEDIVLYAKFDELEKFTISFDSSAYADIESYQGIMPEGMIDYKFPKNLPILISANYTFVGWCLDVERQILITADMRDYYTLEEDITLFAKWLVGDEYKFEIIEEVIDGYLVVYKKYENPDIEIVEIERIKLDEKVIVSLDELKENPTTDKLDKAKETVLNTLEDSIKSCDGKEIISIIGRASGAIDTLELSDNASQNLLDTYSKALSGVRLEKLKLTTILELSEILNDKIQARIYNEKNIKLLKDYYYSLESEVKAKIALFEKEYYVGLFTSFVNQINRNKIICEQMIINAENGFNNKFSFVVVNKQMARSVVTSKNQNYNISLFYLNKLQSNTLDQEVEISIKLLGDVSYAWKGKVKLSNGKTVDAKIDGNYLIFKTNTIGDIEIELIEPYSIIPFYIIIGAIGLFALLYFVAPKVIKQTGKK